MKNKKQLTIIIPFLNEGEEVRNTIKSIREHSNMDEVDILLINDASNDKFDYEAIAKEFNVEYHTNPIRLGVAASRDLGVELCKTKYFLFLDAHMRFYNNKWVDRIISELDIHPKNIICCQTIGLFIVDNELIVNKKRPISYGACIDFYDGERFFEHHWLFEENKDTSHLNTISVPCIMGGAYACSKEYWMYLKGLSGLMFYGNDEAYISIKAWLEGGTCKLLKDIGVGHIYRDSPPYMIANAPRLYNRLLLAELLLPYPDKSRVFSDTKKIYKNIYNPAMYILYKNRSEIHDLKKYYTKILKHDFSYYEQMNNQFGTFKSTVNNKNELLRKIAHHLILNANKVVDIGLLDGKFGIVLFLFQYSRYSNNETYYQFAEQIFDDIINTVSGNIPIAFCNGLTGIGWGIEYLSQNGFLEGDTNDILESFDRKILKMDISNTEDLTLNTGLGGITHYLLARLYVIRRKKKKNSCPSNFLITLYKKLKNVVENKKESDSVDIFIKYLNIYEELSRTTKPTIYDITYLTVPEDFHVEKFVPGLRGSAGVGLKLIFEKFK